MVACRLFEKPMPLPTQVALVSVYTCVLVCLRWWQCEWTASFTFPFKHTNSQLCFWATESGQAECLQVGQRLHANSS